MTATAVLTMTVVHCRPFNLTPAMPALEDVTGVILLVGVGVGVRFQQVS